MKAGFGKIDITPRIGSELYGFGPFLNRRSMAVRDILEARSAAFEIDGQKAVIINCDLCTLGAATVDLICSAIKAKHPELDDTKIMVQCSHTHSGPSTVPANRGWGCPDPVYMEILPYKIAESALAALACMEEAVVSSALVPCEHIGRNRVYDKDTSLLEDVLKEDWKPEKPELTDTQCRVIRFDHVNGTGEMMGFMAYFGCHPVVCCAQTHYIHGDFPAIAIHNLMREFPGTVGLFLQGAEGDVNSCVVHKPEPEAILALDVIAGRFSRAIRQGVAEAKPIKADILKSYSATVEFSTRASFTIEKVESVIKEKENILHNPDIDENSQDARMATVYLQGAQTMLDLLKTDKRSISAKIHAIRLGDIEFLGAPFEIMQAIKNDVVAAAGSPVPLVMSLVDGANGYAPDQTALDKADKSNSYETMTVPFMLGRLPYSDIHRELVTALLEADKELQK